MWKNSTVVELLVVTSYDGATSGSFAVVLLVKVLDLRVKRYALHPDILALFDFRVFIWPTAVQI